jgi:predicted esterase
MMLKRVIRAGLAIGLAMSLHMARPQVLPAQQAPPTAAPQGVPNAPPAGRGRIDPRVQQRTYTFTETSEQMPYTLFVSSKVSSDSKSPLIVALHGLGGNHETMVRESLRTVELAEQGGYVLVAPMGYNCGGWYGIPAGAPRGGGAAAGRGQTAAGTPPAAPPGGAQQAAAPQIGEPNAAAGAAPQRGAGAGRGGAMACAGGGMAVTDTARVRELSEKDVMTVLDMVRKEFNVDERRIYLMGHSMGGSGTLYLGAKHASVWAAVAAIAPPGAGSAEGLAAARMPVFIVQGDMDTAVPVAGTRRYIERLRELNATYEYLEIPSADHSITGIPEIYQFFEKHSRPAP